MKKVAKARKKRSPSRKRRSETNRHGPGNYHPRMHRSEGAWQTGLALHVFAKQKKPAHAQPAREEKIQSIFEEAHASPRNKVTLHATQDRQTPFRFSPRQSHHAPAQDRHLDRSDRLQK